eukprot:CAMPEP_0172067538 /NCGR_PEP_ID=MMETSP1043-20130122/11744_1 /TAXON_ID=464988 /ORGANISM="Hemiselmis andersenii, Strain CCMP441" /LENGTH=35 /DNA_ID= /DNA_START= /DNA_END= /DNA_ORIENTATION=
MASCLPSACRSPTSSSWAFALAAASRAALLTGANP